MAALTKLWDGAVEETAFLDIDSDIEWSLIMRGMKTQVRSIDRLASHKLKPPCLVMLHHGGSFAPFVLDDVQRQILGEMTQADMVAEGHGDAASFRRFWMALNKVSHFSPHERVWKYSFHRFDPYNMDDESGLRAVRRMVGSLYPFDLE